MCLNARFSYMTYSLAPTKVISLDILYYLKKSEQNKKTMKKHSLLLIFSPALNSCTA